MSEPSTQEESQERKPKSKKNSVLDAMVAVDSLPSEPGVNPNSVENRFRPSGIEHHDYIGTRVRRWEVYQADTIRVGMRKLGITTISELESAEGDKSKMPTLCKWLTTCLVHPFKKSGSAKLFRKGTPGLSRVNKDLRDSEVIGALKTCCELSRVFKK